MRAASTDLYQLIQSMNKGEKAFFTRFNTTKKGEKPAAYLVLFDLLAGGGEQEEAVLMKKLKYSDQGSFSTLKNYLYNTLISSLIEYHQSSNHVVEIHRNLQELNILAGKGLTRQYLKRWKKAFKNAEWLEDYTHIFMLKEQLQLLKMNFLVRSDEEELQELVEDDARFSEAHSALQQVRNLYMQVQLHFKKSQIRSGKQELDTVLRFGSQPILQVNYKQRPFRFRYYHCMCTGIIRFLGHYYETALAVLEECRADLEAHPHIITANPYMYTDFIRVYYQVCFVQKAYEPFFSLMEAPINARFQNPEEAAFHFCMLSAARLRYSLSTARFDESRQYGAEIMTGLPRHYEKIPLDLRRNLMASLSIFCFVTCQYNDAFHYCKDAINQHYHNPQQDAQHFLYLFCILITYEMRNNLMIENEIKNAYHFFYRTGRLNPFEKGMIHFLKKIMGKFDKGSRSVLFNELRELLNRFRKDPVSQQAFRYFNFDAWVESKIEGLTYMEYRKRQVGGVG